MRMITRVLFGSTFALKLCRFFGFAFWNCFGVDCFMCSSPFLTRRNLLSARVYIFCVRIWRSTRVILGTFLRPFLSWLTPPPMCSYGQSAFMALQNYLEAFFCPINVVVYGSIIGLCVRGIFDVCGFRFCLFLCVCCCLCMLLLRLFGVCIYVAKRAH